MDLRQWQLIEFDYRYAQQQKALRIADGGLFLTIFTIAVGFWLRPSTAEVQGLLIALSAIGLVIALTFHQEVKYYTTFHQAIQWNDLIQSADSINPHLQSLTWEEWKRLDHWFEMLATDLKGIRRHQKETPHLSDEELLNYLAQFKVEPNDPLASVFQAWYQSEQLEGWETFRSFLGTDYQGVLRQVSAEQRPMTLGEWFAQISNASKNDLN